MTAQARRHRARRGSGDLLRAEILTAAEELLVETGSEELVSVRAIADRVGVTTPSIYLHFADKQTLLDTVCGQVFAQLDERMEQAIITGIAHDTSEAKITVIGVPDRPGIAARVFRPLADSGINIDMIVQNTSADGRTDISFTLPTTDLALARSVLEQVCKDVGAADFAADDDIARISLVGAGMKTHPGVAADMFDALADAGINIEIISTSPIRISCVVRASQIERAVRVVHDRFRLADPLIYREEPTVAAR